MKKYSTNIPELSLKKTKSDVPKVKITSSNDAADYTRQFYSDDLEIYESMFLIILNRANITIAWVKISQGGISGTIADLSIIAKYAISALASGIILVHNHPSGNKNASQADINLTRKLKEGLKLFDINLLDHIILTSESYTSMADESLF